MTKKNKLALSLVAVAACAGAFGTYENYQQSGESDALLAENVEALSNGESGAKCPNGCRHIGWGWDKILECDCDYDRLSSCDSWGC